MYEFSDLSVWLPGEGVVLRDATLRLEPGTVTMFVGAHDSGLPALFQAITDTLPPGARVRGKQRPESDVLFLSDALLPPLRVTDFLLTLTDDVATLAAQVGLLPYLGHRIAQIPLDMRTNLHLARLLHAPLHAWVVLDSVLTAADPGQCRAVIEAVHDRAAAGAGVLWAEADVNVAWQAADRIVELHQGTIRYDGNPMGWVPTSVAEPTLLTLARVLGLPLESSRTAGQLHQALKDSGLKLPSRRTGMKPPTRTTSYTVAGEIIGQSGSDLEIGRDECLGLVSLSGRPEPIARRIITALPQGDWVPSRSPHDVAAWADAWERTHQLQTGSILNGAAHHHSWEPQRWAQIRRAAILAPAAPVWIAHPQAGLDARAQHQLATAFQRGVGGPRIVTSRDVEFLVRACHRLIVVDDDVIVADGSPYAVAGKLPDLPLVATATGSERYLRLHDVFTALETP